MHKIQARLFQANTLAVAAVFGITLLATSAPAQTAQVSGVGNFHQVNDHIYRGAQPTDAGFQSLAKLGVKTIIDLRETDDRSAHEKKVVEAAGMKYINIPMQGMTTPTNADVEKALALFNDPSTGKVFVHCRRGADRTGTVVACYRISHDGWDNTKALNEAKANGMAWIQVAMHHYVMGYHPAIASAAAAAGVQN